MKISEKLIAIASWLEDSNNEALTYVENDDDSLSEIAFSCISAAEELRKAAERLAVKENILTPEALDELSSIASALDSSEDERLQKQASVIDQLLLSIAATGNVPGMLSSRQDYLHGDMEEAHQKFIERNLKERPDAKKIADAEKAIEQSGATKEYKVLEAPLQARGCPDHPGTPMARIAENTYQCALDHKIYDYQVGYTLENGQQVPGSSVANQNVLEYKPEYTAFDSREDRLRSKI